MTANDQEPGEAAWRALVALLAEIGAALRAGDAPRLMQHRRSLDEIRTAEGDIKGDTLIRDCYGGLVAARLDGPLVIAQIGQSLDGRIAAANGQSRYINGPQGLDHLHRLRALSDAVIVGASTVALDDPQLTTRRVCGANPVRVVIDPHRRVPLNSALLRDGQADSYVVHAQAQAQAPGEAPGKAPGKAREIILTEKDGALSPHDILKALSALGLRVILVEGGAATLSRFLAAGVVDRLHVTVAPLVLGSGPTGLRLPGASRMEDGLRPAIKTWPLGEDWLFDCDLRAAGGPANRGGRP